MSELNYSKEEINRVWNDLRSAEKELEKFETKDAEPKKQLIIRIRDKVDILVKAKKIMIKENEISNYVLSKLEEKGISYSKTHFYNLFEARQKRNYSKVSNDTFVHKHEFNLLVDDEQYGKWEKCYCGINRINGIDQIDKHVEENDSKKKLAIREIVEPTGDVWDYLSLKKAEFLECIRMIDQIRQKCTLDITSVKKQTTDHPIRKAPPHAYQKLLDNTQLLTEKRIQVVVDEFSHVDSSKIDETKKSIAQIMNAYKKVNDRTKLTNYEKGMAKILIEKFDFLIGDMAGILNVTTKHVKNNILKLNSKSANDQDGIFEQLDFLARCPGCGLGIADHVDKKYEEFTAGKYLVVPNPLKLKSVELMQMGSEDDFSLDSFPLPTYAKQVVQLKQEIRQHEIIVEKTNGKLRTAAITIQKLSKK